MSFHELLGSSVTVSFVVTERDFSLLCYRIFWWVMKGFVLEVALRHAHLTWSFPSVPAVQIYKKAAGRKRAVASAPRDKSTVLSLHHFWGFILPVIILKFTWTCSIGLKEEKKVKEIRVWCPFCSTTHLIFEIFFGPNSHFTTYWLKKAQIQIHSAYIQVLWHLQFVTGMVWWFAVSVMTLSLP